MLVKSIPPSSMQMPYQYIEINYYFLFTRCNQHNVTSIMYQWEDNVVKIPVNQVMTQGQSTDTLNVDN